MTPEGFVRGASSIASLKGMVESLSRKRGAPGLLA